MKRSWLVAFVVVLMGCSGSNPGPTTSGKGSFIGSAWHSLEEAASPSRKTSVIVILVDLGDSTVSMRDRYRRELQKVGQACGAGDTVIIDSLSFASRAMSDPLQVDFTVPDGTNDYHAKGLLSEKHKKLAEAFESVFVRKGTLAAGDPKKEKTELLAAIANAARYFEGRKNTDKRLLLFSDGVEQSDRIDMMGSWLTEREQQDVIAKLKVDGILPTLTGVQVWVVGATLDTEMPSSRATKIEAFWRLFFKQSGTTLDPSRWNAALFDYPPTTPSQGGS